MTAPSLVIVFPVEDAAYAYVESFSFEDEGRVLFDLRNRDLFGETFDAVAHLVEVLDVDVDGEDATT